MTGTTRSTQGLDARRRKLLFRSWHRGMREMDLVLGGFADRFIEDLTEDEIEQYEALLNIPDAEMLGWVTGRDPLPKSLDTPLVAKILAASRA